MEILKGQQLLKKSGLVVDADQALAGKKIICFYFSAQWCPPCKAFTPVLAEFYMVSGISNKNKNARDGIMPENYVHDIHLAN